MATSRLQIAKPDILKLLDQGPSRVLSSKDLGIILKANRDAWRVAKGTTLRGFIEFLQGKAHLKKVVLNSDEGYPAITRYVWREATPYELATSLKPGAYLSHGTAAYIHGLSDDPPKTLYVNAEQSPKPEPRATLTQVSLSNAFKRPQRVSKLAYLHDSYRLVVLAGKYTNALGVETSIWMNTTVRVTGLERTLIDIVVRPYYSGGPNAILQAYAAAKDRVSTNKMVAILGALRYVYPYHQAVGFYLDRAGFPKPRVESLKALPMDFDFHLLHGLADRDVIYIPEWRLFVPKGM